MSFRTLCSLLALLALPAAATAQSVAGTWMTPAPRGAVVLTLRVSGSTVSGTLVGNGVTMNVKGTTDADEAFGTIEDGTGTAVFTARVDGGRLVVSMIENGANGQPNPAAARELIFTRTAAGAVSAGAVAAAPAAGAARAGGNPLAGGRGAADPLEGTFVSDELTAVVRRSASGYGGVLSLNGTDYPFTATANGTQLSGTFVVGGERYPFQSRLAGDEMTLSSGGRDYPMTRKVDAAAGAARSSGAARGVGAAAPARAPAGGGIGLAGSTGVQERQIAELLVSSAWCTMSYSSGSTYSGGSYGRSNTERVVFAADGQGSTTAGSEGSNSGAGGTVASSGSNGQRFMWKIQGMNLMLSQDGAQWAPTPLQIYDNGSGAPIVKSNGKEYNRCR